MREESRTAKLDLTQGSSQIHTGTQKNGFRKRILKNEILSSSEKGALVSNEKKVPSPTGAKRPKSEGVVEKRRG